MHPETFYCYPNFHDTTFNYMAPCGHVGGNPQLKKLVVYRIYLAHNVSILTGKPGVCDSDGGIPASAEH